MASDPPPVPLAAHFYGAIATVEFDRFLTSGPLDVSNWFVRYGGLSKTVNAADAEGHVPGILDLYLLAGGVPNPGPDVVSYSPPPFDVVSRTGIPAAAFADYPITP